MIDYELNFENKCLNFMYTYYLNNNHDYFKQHSEVIFLDLILFTFITSI